MTISTTIPTFLRQLEESNDPAVAYFSFAADEHGERGVIRANKEGLRLYAAELLKKSMQMEAIQDGQHICFQPCEWLVSDAGYDLISAVKPEYASRAAIISAANAPVHTAAKKDTPRSKRKGWFGVLFR